MSRVSLRRERVHIPTYEIAQYDKNPMFLEKRVYQGSSGRVYPHPVSESVSDTKTDRVYDAVFLENDWLLVMLLPELGGRVQRLYDKTNGYDAVYYNEVIKPALVGLAGPWISGGIEFNWPQHHRPSTFDPVDVAFEERDDGSATVWLGETEHMFHTKSTVGFTLYPDRAYLEISGRLYNPTDRPQTFLWWANPAVAVNEHTQSVFPPDVTAVMDHGKRDVSKFPIADGVYYKVDYSPGTDISRYKNIPVPTSYMAYRSDFDFIGSYDHEKRAGLLHIADHHISPGKKQWTWGNGDFGRAWDRNLTDENGPYIELMTGIYTDNQPDFTFLKPYEEKTFSQYFMPYKNAGAVKNANLEAALNVEVGGEVTVTVYSPSGLKDAILTVRDGGRVIYSSALDIEVAGTFAVSIKDEGAEYDSVTVQITRRDGSAVISHAPVKRDTAVPDAAEALPEPADIPTNEKLFLAAVHLEQYRHATRSPEPYYLEGLRRDPTDIRINNGYGKFLYARGQFGDSIPYFRAAVASSTWKNPNPYDCEPYYNLGLALEAVGDDAGAFDAYYKATWDGAMHAAAFYRLANIASRWGKYGDALGFAEQSLSCGAHNMKARTLKAALLRRLGRREDAAAFAKESKSLDMLDHGCRFELSLLSEEDGELSAVMRGDSGSYIELALTYIAAGLCDEARLILSRAPGSDPMVHYYLYFCGDDGELAQAEDASPLYCFPNRLEDIPVLQKAAAGGGERAKYYLGLLFYDRGRWRDAVFLWEACAESVCGSLPTVYRNLALAYYNKMHDGERALTAMDRAFSLDTGDARVYFERDCLLRLLGVSPEERLADMRAHAELLPLRDDLYTEFITLLNMCGQSGEAYERIMSRNFHPWEGGEGKITAQYRATLIAKAEGEPERAVEHLTSALEYPHNLGEGKLAGCLDNDIYYLLGLAYKKMGADGDARRAFTLAARGQSTLAAAAYYNDRPPEHAFYAALAKAALGDTDGARAAFCEFIRYAEEHMGDEPKIDYFAVSLPDFLIFDGDLKKKNRVHCHFLSALGHIGLGEYEKAAGDARLGLRLDPSHAGLRLLLSKLTGTKEK